MTDQYAGAPNRCTGSTGTMNSLILGFPHQFGHQNQSGRRIRTFYRTKFDVTFPMFAKVNERPKLTPCSNASRRLDRAGSGQAGWWNFTSSSSGAAVKS